MSEADSILTWLTNAGDEFPTLLSGVYVRTSMLE